MDLKQIAQAAIRSTIATEGVPGILGRANGEVYYTGPDGDVALNQCWARIGAAEFVVAIEGVPIQVNLPVIIAQRYGIPTVIRADTQRADQFTGGRPLGVAAHGWTHGRLSPDPVLITGLAFLPLMAYPNSPMDLTVNVVGGNYKYLGVSKYLPDTNVDLSSYLSIPPGVQKCILICLDRATNTLVVVVVGTIAAHSSIQPFTADIIMAVASTLAANYAPLVAIRYLPGQTQITGQNIILDLRHWLGDKRTGVLDDLDDVAIASPVGLHAMMYDSVTGLWKNRYISANDIPDLAESVSDTIGSVVDGSASIAATFSDVADTTTLSVIPGGIDHGALGGLTDIADHPDYLVTSGARAGAVAGVQSFTNNTVAPWYDLALMDATNGDHFNVDVLSGPPASWAGTVSPAASSGVSGGFWHLIGSGVVDSYYYESATPYEIEALPAGADFLSAIYGPIFVYDGRCAADVTYYFGLYKDGGSAPDANQFSRIALMWDATASVWQVRHEYKDGTTQTNGYWFPLEYPPLVQPLWIRVTVGNAGECRGYIGYTQLPNRHSLIGTGTITGAAWGEVWAEIHMARGTSGSLDLISIGGIDFTTIENNVGIVTAPPTPSGGGDAATLDGIDSTGFSLAAHTHTDYALLAGRAAGQHLKGGTAANEDLTLEGTAHATKATSYLILQPTGGNVGINKTAPVAALDVAGNAIFGDGSIATSIVIDGAAGTSRQVAFRSGGLNRWLYNVSTTAESGSNAGSDFQLLSRNDAGSAIGTPFHITRATGDMGLGTTAPQGRFHAWDGTGGMLFVSKTGIVGTAVVLIPNGTGDVTKSVSMWGTVSNNVPLAGGLDTFLLNGTATAMSFSGGANVITFTVNANGELSVARTAGTATWSVSLLLVWQ